MQTNPNIEDKRIVEIYDWKDYRYDYNPWGKKYNRRLRRKRQKRLLDKAIEEVISSMQNVAPQGHIMQLQCNGK